MYSSARRKSAAPGSLVTRSARLEPEVLDEMPVAMCSMAPQPMALRQAEVVSAGVLSASFGIPGRSDVPSDEGSHKVVIAVLDLGAELEWVSVPREKESVFLRVSFVDSISNADANALS